MGEPKDIRTPPPAPALWPTGHSWARLTHDARQGRRPGDRWATWEQQHGSKMSPEQPREAEAGKRSGGGAHTQDLIFPALRQF